jgi:hypothetical protein
LILRIATFSAHRVVFLADRQQPGLVHRGEQQPVDVGRLDPAQALDLGDDAPLVVAVERFPQRLRRAQQGIREVGRIDQRLAMAFPQQVVRAGRIDRVGIALQRQLLQALPRPAFGVLASSGSASHGAAPEIRRPKHSM